MQCTLGNGSGIRYWLSIAMQVGNGISPQSTYRESVLAVVNAPMIDSEALDTGLNFSASRTNSKQTQAKIELGYFQDQSAIKKMGMFLVEKNILDTIFECSVYVLWKF